jgi:pimeloyl-[acyl-carrier protein] methyl ester esterase
MTQEWLKQSGFPTLVIFFTGWGMNASSTNHLETGDYDFLVCSGYTDIGEIAGLEKYGKILVVGYSMGVMAAEGFMQKTHLNPSATIAINGSVRPVSDEYGIGIEQYRVFNKGLTENSYKTFIFNMSGSAAVFRRYLRSSPGMDIPALQHELTAIETLQETIEAYRPWDKVILCEGDNIFPYEGLRKYWKDSCSEFIIFDAPHYPFFLWENWDEILQISAKTV